MLFTACQHYIIYKYHTIKGIQSWIISHHIMELVKVKMFENLRLLLLAILLPRWPDTSSYFCKRETFLVKQSRWYKSYYDKYMNQQNISPLLTQVTKNGHHENPQTFSYESDEALPDYVRSEDNTIPSLTPG